MIFTPENVKKLQDIVVVVYRGKYGNYEVAAHPKRLYEYRRNTACLEEVLCTESIFSDISRGKLASKKSIKDEFNTTERKALEIILSQGTERKDSATREYEQQNARKAVAEGLVQRVRKGGNKVLTHQEAEEVLKKINYTPSAKPIKIQLSDVLKKAVHLGYSRRALRVKVDKEMDWSEIVDTLPHGSFFRKAENVIEASDDLYGAINRLAAASGAEIEELPEVEDAEIEL
ncbi:ribosome maturation protein SDO1 [Nematocida minor]|uniref:ribosome maturation protein SDO1 n=1 Tax=Nematocida minor TaxID=1912983 RepID=UPI00221F273D|nr:ribosome maturation protein SDO1 [Nematocida minor]XP_051332026.1 ribosome maturation protein SDO1 [Nematocida minor]KAI5188756.1 ribosome maturation protein SDO1 [Nematocida minor]KAI5188860.1 ribosome maturation protein SDO1 [Nematocida minor]